VEQAKSFHTYEFLGPFYFHSSLSMASRVILLKVIIFYFLFIYLFIFFNFISKSSLIENVKRL